MTLPNETCPECKEPYANRTEEDYKAGAGGHVCSNPTIFQYTQAAKITELESQLTQAQKRIKNLNEQVRHVKGWLDSFGSDLQDHIKDQIRHALDHAIQDEAT